MGKVKWLSKDVHWYSNYYKRPIAYSTIAESNSITLVYNSFCYGVVECTANNILKAYIKHNLTPFDGEFKVLKAFIDRGLGNEELTLQ